MILAHEARETRPDRQRHDDDWPPSSAPEEAQHPAAWRERRQRTVEGRGKNGVVISVSAVIVSSCGPVSRTPLGRSGVPPGPAIIKNNPSRPHDPRPLSGVRMNGG